MIGQSPAQAIANLLQTLQRCLSCVTDAVLHPAPVQGRGSDNYLRIGLGAAGGRLRGDGPAVLIFSEYVATEQLEGERRRWRAHAVGYACSLAQDDGHEYLSYHWHDQGPSHVRTPHLHLGAGAGLGWPLLVKAHLPTGVVLLPAIIELAIDLGARPLRADWRETLAVARAALAEA